MHDQKTPGQSWYREPMMWMVLGGPLVVVVASIITYVLAVSQQDPVLERDPVTESQHVRKDLTPEQLESMAPALKVRNHVASPEVPSDK
jgi:uncharacterized protein